MREDEVVAGLRAHSHPLASVDPDGDTTDLEPFRSHADAADIVGLGEATHGTREFVTLKHRLVRVLVAECGFRTVCLETDFVNTLALDAFVRDGTGPLADALDDVLLWVWKTESMRNLLSWLRAFNEGRPPEDRVRFRGVSLSTPAGSAGKLLELFEGHGMDPPELHDLERLAGAEIPDDASAREALLDTGSDVASALRGSLEGGRGEYVAQRSEPEWALARRLCRHLEQNCEWNRLRLATPGTFDPEAFERRDRYMAENVGWCLDTDPGDGVVLWAHNTHVKRGSFDMAHDWATGTAMGEFLAREHGSRYRPYATAFGRGTYRAKAESEGSAGEGPRVFAVEEPLDGSVAAWFERLGRSTRFLDVEDARDDERLASWVDGDRRLRAHAALVDPTAEPERRHMHTDLAESFDGLFFVPESSPTSPLDTA